MALIYCVEDDESIRELVLYALKNSGFKAKGFSHGNIDYSQADLIILDIMLPGDDGFTILENLRTDPLTKDIPVIMLTAKTAELDKVRSLDMGADDYVEKPFSIMELISRVKAVLRRSYSSKLKLSYDQISLLADKHQVYVGEKEVRLTHKEFKLLEYLLINKGLVLTREQILEEVWGYDYLGETRTIDVHIRSLRVKLADQGRHIKTIVNVGYRLGD